MKNLAVHRSTVSNTLFYTIGIAFTGGIFLRSFLNLGTYEIAFIIFLGAIFLFIHVITFKNKIQHFLLVGLACIFLALGMIRLNSEETKSSLLSIYQDQEIELIGRVVREPEQRETTTHLYIQPQLKEQKATEQVLITTDLFKVSMENISYGDTVSVKGKITKPEPFESNGGRIFDYPGYLKTRNVTHVIRYAEVELVSKDESSFLSGIYTGKQQFMNSLEHILPMPHAGLGEGILLGVKRALGKDLEETFRETGIIHIVVLSGYNVMIVVEAMMLVLAYFFLPKMRMVIGITAIALFVLLVGPSATVVRAAIMASLLLVARATGRVYAIMRALLLAGIIMLIANPYLLVHDPGFQLSFIATLALILFAPHVERWLRFIPETGGVRTIVTATVATQVMVLPLLLYHMGLFSLVSVLVNVLILPMVPIAMLLTFLTGVLGIFVEPLGVLVGFVSYYSLGYIIGVSEFFGALPFAAISVSKFPVWVMFLAYVGMTLGLVTLHKRKHEPKVEPQSNTYKDWTIEEEKSDDAQSTSSDSSLPFR